MIEEVDPDVAWVARLSGASEPAVERALAEAQGETRLFRHLASRHRAGGRQFYVEIEAPLELYALTRLLQPRHIVEVGVSSGVSSAYFLQALSRNGRGTLHSVDLPRTVQPKRRGTTGQGPSSGSWALPPGESSGWAVPFPLRSRWDLRLGDKADVLPLLGEELDTVDLFLYDVPHSDPAAFREFRSLDRRMTAGAVALVDHGGTTSQCPSLARWAKTRRASGSGRTGLGLFAFRFP